MQSPAQKARRSTVRPDGTPARVTRRRAETRTRLLEAAFSVFASKGFGRATIGDVCDAAGYTRGAFYSNFDTLDELFYALTQQRSEMIHAQVAAAVEAGGGDRKVLLDSVIDPVMVDRDWNLVRTDFLVYAARNPAAAEALLAQKARERQSLAEVLERWVDSARLPAPLQSPDGLARALIAIHDGAMEHVLLCPAPQELRDWLTDLFSALLF
jgi:AcrR family transcriptional regulator